MLRLGAGAMRRTGGARRLLGPVTRQLRSRQTPQEQLIAGEPGECRQHLPVSFPAALQTVRMPPERELGRRSCRGKLQASPTTRPMEIGQRAALEAAQPTESGLAGQQRLSNTA